MSLPNRQNGLKAKQPVEMPTERKCHVLAQKNVVNSNAPTRTGTIELSLQSFLLAPLFLDISFRLFKLQAATMHLLLDPCATFVFRARSMPQLPFHHSGEGLGHPRARLRAESFTDFLALSDFTMSAATFRA